MASHMSWMYAATTLKAHCDRHIISFCSRISHIHTSLTKANSLATVHLILILLLCDKIYLNINDTVLLKRVNVSVLFKSVNNIDIVVP